MLLFIASIFASTEDGDTECPPLVQFARTDRYRQPPAQALVPDMGSASLGMQVSITFSGSLATKIRVY